MFGYFFLEYEHSHSRALGTVADFTLQEIFHSHISSVFIAIFTDYTLNHFCADIAPNLDSLWLQFSIMI